MKDKIIMFILGALIGAILTAGGFLVFGHNPSEPMRGREDMPQRGQMEEGIDGDERGRREEMGENQIEAENAVTIDENVTSDTNTVEE